MSHPARPALSTGTGLHGWEGLEQLYCSSQTRYVCLPTVCPVIDTIWTLERAGRYGWVKTLSPPPGVLTTGVAQVM